ncbi:hypothetical protein GQ44DRAFT_619470 [Phaeosphaeriaceae sp. PMI808]|nr:hypothetical protein GQ44DRAFT_619470 [Phaeosphaeriaceae sp. PMI808]
MSTSSLVDKVLHPSQFRLEALKSTEDVILQKRLEYINHLTRKQAEDYKLLLTILPSAFCTSLSNVGDEYVPWIFDFGAGIGCQRQVRMGKSWMSWYILSEGLDPFWQQWWSLPHDDRATENYIRDRAIKAFTNTPEKLADHHRLVALQLQTAVNELVTTDSGDIDLNSFSPVRYFAEYRLVKRYREQDGLPPVLETLEHVPFLINFRCPEERLRMIESARGQAYARESAQGRQ